MPESYKLATGKTFIYYLSQNINVKTTTLSDIMKEWLALKSKLQHVIIEVNSWKKFEASIKNNLMAH